LKKVFKKKNKDEIHLTLVLYKSFSMKAVFRLSFHCWPTCNSDTGKMQIALMVVSPYFPTSANAIHSLCASIAYITLLMDAFLSHRPCLSFCSFNVRSLHSILSCEPSWMYSSSVKISHRVFIFTTSLSALTSFGTLHFPFCFTHPSDWFLLYSTKAIVC
jgi:hypothetical protein